MTAIDKSSTAIECMGIGFEQYRFSAKHARTSRVRYECVLPSAYMYRT